MNILNLIRKQLKSDEIFIYRNIWGDSLKVGFDWNKPLEETEILSFESNYFKLPKYYKELLLFSNGVTLFKELEYLEFGCKIYGLEELLQETHKRIKWGYELPSNWIVFAEFYGSSDFLPLYGTYVLGRFWFFVLLQGQKYSVSPAFDATKIEDLASILSNMQKVKEAIHQHLNI